MCLDNQPDSYTDVEAEPFAGARRQVNDEALAGLDLSDDPGAFTVEGDDGAGEDVPGAQSARFLVGDEDVAGADGEPDGRARPSSSRPFQVPSWTPAVRDSRRRIRLTRPLTS